MNKTSYCATPGMKESVLFGFGLWGFSYLGFCFVCFMVGFFSLIFLCLRNIKAE